MVCMSLKHCCIPEVSVDIVSICPRSRISLLFHHLPEFWLLYLLSTSHPTFQYLKGPHKKDGEELCTRACTRGNGFKLKKGRFTLDIERNSLL